TRPRRRLARQRGALARRGRGDPVPAGARRHRRCRPVRRDPPPAGGAPVTVDQLNAICAHLAAADRFNELRRSAEGVVAVHDERLYGGRARPWSVVWTPPGHHTHWPTMSLHEQDVAGWAVLRAVTA